MMPLLERTLPKSIAVAQRRSSSTMRHRSRPGAARAGAAQPRAQRQGCDGRHRHARRSRADGRSPTRAQVHVELGRDTGCGMDEATRAARVRAVLHDEAARQGHRPRPRRRCGASCRRTAARRRSSRGPAAARRSRSRCRCRRRSRRRCRPRERPSTAVVRGTVLLVDDEPAVRSTSKRLLERMGLDVSTAENGAEALDVFAQARGGHPARHPRHGHAGDGRRRMLPPAARAQRCAGADRDRLRERRGSAVAGQRRRDRSSRSRSRRSSSRPRCCA